MSTLTFNASTSDRDALASVSDEPFQIMPGGRSVLDSATVDTFHEMKNNRILIHASYITRPFNADVKPYTNLNLKCYSKLAHRLGTKHILIHMPSNLEEYEHYADGLILISKFICDQGCFCHLETNPMTKDLRLHLGINKDNAVRKYYRYIDMLFDVIPATYRESFRMAVDTAHMFANGFDGLEIVKFLKKYEDKIDFIHLNGNKNAMFTRDNHIPMYDSVNNRIDHVPEIMKQLSSMHIPLIAEDSTIKGSYSLWKDFVSEYGIDIVEERLMYSI